MDKWMFFHRNTGSCSSINSFCFVFFFVFFFFFLRRMFFATATDASKGYFILLGNVAYIAVPKRNAGPTTIFSFLCLYGEMQNSENLMKVKNEDLSFKQI